MSEFDKHMARIDAALMKHTASLPKKAMRAWEPGGLLLGGLLSGIIIFAALLLAGIKVTS